MLSESEFDPEVLIVGAGPVGLALAIELGQRGIRCLVVERNDRVGYNPRAKLTNVRSREHLRRWGIADALREASPMPPDYPSNIVFATRLDGPLLARFDNAFNCKRERNDLYSEEAQWVPQYTLEEVLRVHATSFPNVRVRFNSRVEQVSQSEHDVLAIVADTVTGEAAGIRSVYLVGADGGRSTVRDMIGARMMGQGAFSRNYNVMFRAPALASLHRHGPAIQYWLVNADVPCLMGPMDSQGLWYFIATKIDDEIDASTVDPREFIRRATGFDFEMEIVGTDPWVAHRLIADRYAAGRIYLAGDACHLHPPFGGFGLNMGLGDAVDLGWKMAATLQGWGGPELLGSYEAERRPVHERVLREAVANYATTGNQLIRPGIEEPGPTGDATRREVGDIIIATKVREFKTLGVVLGYCYQDSPIVVPDASEPPPDHFMLYDPTAHPGCLAPHLWLRDGSSLYDGFGQGFTLLVLDETGADDAHHLTSAAGEIGLPFKIVVPNDNRLAGRYRARYALIRPDQHVAWRGDAIPADARGLLDRVRGAALRIEGSTPQPVAAA
ncbi:MAG: FAD-monooxygenase [Mesorhizobium sp.]|uniref:FAD-dependent monooxygenase n=1 Tax=Mesorhizobium sp. TaxID=1871066 RepID=UPI000FE6AE89|nr:FAD-dependent monooxygenase [Mesorhizobium sp.]RWI57083.1 MAG: FAD-monooxygenase [Mesorhizobium sp.]